MIVTDVPMLHLESKRTERLNIYEAVAQAEHDCNGKIPVVCHKKNNKDWIAVMPLEDLLLIISKSIYYVPLPSVGEVHGDKGVSERAA